MLLSAFTAADVNGLWSYVGTDQVGTMAFDGGGFINGGTLTNTSGTVTPASGTYSIDSSGAFTITTPTDIRTGGINSSGDFIALSQTNLDARLTALVSSGTGSFSNADLSGSWNLVLNGSSLDSNGSGTVVFDGAGGISDGTIATATGSMQIIDGYYTLNSDGTCTLHITTNTPSGTHTRDYTGALNASKDILALDPNPETVANDGGPNLTLAVRSRGVYSLADLKGTWSLSTQGSRGTFVCDGSGHISSGTLTSWDGQPSSISGTYSVSANGIMSVNVAFTDNGTTKHITPKGSINASRNVVVLNGTTNDNDVAILVKNAPHSPVLSTVVPFFTAAAGQPFTITYDQLVGHSDATVSNGQPLQFQITAGTAGTLAINGTNVSSFPATLGPGGTLTWTSSDTASGAVAAFSLKASDGTTLSTTAVTVTVNTIIPSPFSVASASGIWNAEGSSSYGYVELDGAGSITGGSFTDDSDQTHDATGGTYTIDPAGSVTVHADNTLTGALNASHDVMAITSDNLNVLLNSQDGNFANADMVGQWTMAVNGPTIDGNGVGTLTCDANGHITAGTFRGGTGTQPFTGSYVLNSTSGSLTINIFTQENGSSHTMTLTGAINNSRDVIALDPPDMQAAANNHDSNLILLVHGAGTYSNADAKGTWIIAANGGSGAVTLDGAGKIANGYIQEDGRLRPLTGTYSVSSSGAWTLHIKAGGTDTIHFSGALNKSRNTIIMNATTNDPDETENLVVLINSADHAPTLTSISAFATAFSGRPFQISYAQLAAHGNEADLDGDAISFKILSLASGSSLTRNGSPVTSFPATVGENDDLVWTPAATTKGKVKAFTVVATDGTLASAKAVPVTINTVLTPTIKLAMTKAKASELNGTTTGAGAFTFTRTNGDMSASQNVVFNFTGSATFNTDYLFANSTAVTYDAVSGVGTITLAAKQTKAVLTINPIDDLVTDPGETVKVAIVSDSSYVITNNTSQASATLTIADDTRPLIWVVVTTLPGDAHVGSPFTITYQNLVDATHVAARSGAITFRITKISKGTLRKNGDLASLVANSTAATLTSLDTLSFTASTTGTPLAFSVVAVNGTNLSTALTIPIHVLA